MARISKSGITNGGTIDSTHLTRIIEALDGTGSAAIYATGSFTGSFIGDGSQLTGIAGGGGTPGGSDTEIQYNNSNTFDGVPALTYAGSVLRATGSFSGSLRGQVTGSVSGSFRGQATGSFTGSFSGTATGSFSGSFRGQATGSYTGSFVGDGSGLTGIAGGGGALTWITRANETTPTQAMLPNYGYILTGNTGGTAVFTLPSSGTSIGDIIKIIAYSCGANWQIIRSGTGTILYSFLDIMTNNEWHGPGTFITFTDTNDSGTGFIKTRSQSVTLTCVSASTTNTHWNIDLANGKMFS